MWHFERSHQLQIASSISICSILTLFIAFWALLGQCSQILLLNYNEPITTLNVTDRINWTCFTNPIISIFIDIIIIIVIIIIVVIINIYRIF